MNNSPHKTSTILRCGLCDRKVGRPVVMVFDMDESRAPLDAEGLEGVGEQIAQERQTTRTCSGASCGAVFGYSVRVTARWVPAHIGPFKGSAKVLDVETVGKEYKGRLMPASRKVLGRPLTAADLGTKILLTPDELIDLEIWR